MLEDGELYMRRLRAGRGHAVFETLDPLLDAVGVPMRVNFPHESSSTMITGLAAMRACITRQRPASLM